MTETYRFTLKLKINESIVKEFVEDGNGCFVEFSSAPFSDLNICFQTMLTYIDSFIKDTEKSDAIVKLRDDYIMSTVGDEIITNITPVASLSKELKDIYESKEDISHWKNTIVQTHIHAVGSKTGGESIVGVGCVHTGSTCLVNLHECFEDFPVKRSDDSFYIDGPITIQ